MKLKSGSTAKDIITRVKRRPTELERKNNTAIHLNIQRTQKPKHQENKPVCKWHMELAKSSQKKYK